MTQSPASHRRLSTPSSPMAVRLATTTHILHHYTNHHTQVQASQAVQDALCVDQPAEVERILSHEQGTNPDDIKYLVKFVGYPDTESDWFPESDILASACTRGKEALQEYWAQQRTKWIVRCMKNSCCLLCGAQRVLHTSCSKHTHTHKLFS